MTSQTERLSDDKRLLLEQLLRRKGIDVGGNAAGIPRRADRGHAPLSFAQQRLWFLDRLDPGSAAYTIPAVLRLHGPLRVDALQAALDQVVARHEALRTTVATLGSAAEPAQIVSPDARITIDVMDLIDRPAEAPALIQAEVVRPFDLAVGPLTRLTLLRVAPQEHVLVVCMHHILSDAWSIGVLIDELARAYEAGATGTTAELGQDPVQFGDVAAWQRQRADDGGDADLDYWREALAGIPTILQLPTDRPRPSQQTSRGGALPFQVPAVLTQRLVALGRAHDATLFMTLLAAFAVLLSRYADTDDVVVGSPVAGRGRADLDGVIGFFVNTLVLRTDLSGDPTFGELLTRVRDTALAGFAHDAVPFEQLVRDLSPERDLSHNPLFQVLFSLQNAPLPPFELAGLHVEVEDVHTGTSRFDFALVCEQAGDALDGQAEFNADLFDQATIARMLRHFATLLAEVADDPDRPVSALPLLTEEERRRELAAAATTGRPAGAVDGALVHQLIARRARENPAAVAATFGGATVSYRELDQRGNRLARHLQAMGVGPDDIVALCLDRGLDALVAMLGVLKAGGAYLPLDPADPSARLALVITDARPAVLITRAELAPRLPTGEVRVVAIDAEADAIAALSPEEPDCAATSTNLAYVIYTSGSTGRPKGVLIEHRGLANLALTNVFELGTGRRMLQFAPLTFDASVAEIFSALVAGATLVLAAREALLPGPELLDLLRGQHVTNVILPPSVLAALPATELDDLDTLIVAGEACPAELVARWSKGRVMVNAYGPTEATVCATATRCVDDGAPPPLGHAIANASVHVLDQAGNPVPPGVAGELHIGGVGVARGYLNLPEVTAERFVDHPDLGRLYRSGDRARRRGDGALAYLGRIDDQVKVRGFRIEPGEVEAALRRHPGVREAAVVARADAGDGAPPGASGGRGSDGPPARLVAYIVPAGAAAPTVTGLRAALDAELPAHLIPSAFVTLDALPLSANGKLDRAALPAPDSERPTVAAEFTAPAAGAEEALAAIWAGTLGLDRVGADDNFFELGGDSIVAIQIVARANDAGLRLTPRQLFQHQTVATLAAVAGTAPSVEAEQGAVTGPVPMTPIQRWFTDLVEGRAPDHFNQAVLLDAPPEVDRGALTAALDALVTHHDALRLRWTRAETGVPEQWCEPVPVTVPLDEIDLSDVTPAEQDQALAAHATGLHARLDLAEGLLLRAALYRLGGARPPRLLLVAHHLGVDAVSWRILVEDLRRAYAAAAGGQPVALPPKTTSFKQWSELLSTAAERGGRFDDQLAYWRRAVPAAIAAPGEQADAGTAATADRVPFWLDAGTTAGLLTDVPAAYHSQVNDALLAALVQAFHRWAGKPGILVGLEGHGREELFAEADLSRTVGWFTSLFPVWLPADDPDDPGATLKQTKERLRSVPDRGIGFGVLRYLHPDGADLARLPAAQVGFNYVGQYRGESSPAGRPGSRPHPSSSGTGDFREVDSPSGQWQSPSTPRPHVLDVSAAVEDGRLQVALGYSTTAHAREDVVALAEHYRTALEALVEHCRDPHAGGHTPSDFPLAGVDQDELDRLVAFDDHE